MKYKGIELVEITSPQVFDPPKKMVVWNNNVTCNEPSIQTVYAVIIKETGTKQAIGECCRWSHCAEIPEEPKPRQATNRELSKWLAQGNGEYRNQIGIVCSAYTYDEPESDKAVNSFFKVRKWYDTEWNEPTVDYMGIEDKQVNRTCSGKNFFKEDEVDVKVGNQIWMAKNLDINDGGEGIYFNQDNGEYYYTWEAAKRIADKIPGWHLPSRDEWVELLTVVETNSLLQEGYWRSRFDVKPTGYWNETFIANRTTTNFWSSSIDETCESNAWRIYMSNTPYSSWESRHKTLGFSVRLVKDR